MYPPKNLTPPSRATSPRTWRPPSFYLSSSRCPLTFKGGRPPRSRRTFDTRSERGGRSHGPSGAMAFRCREHCTADGGATTRPTATRHPADGPGARPWAAVPVPALRSLEVSPIRCRLRREVRRKPKSSVAPATLGTPKNSGNRHRPQLAEREGPLTRTPTNSAEGRATPIAAHLNTLNKSIRGQTGGCLRDVQPRTFWAWRRSVRSSVSDRPLAIRQVDACPPLHQLSWRNTHARGHDPHAEDQEITGKEQRRNAQQASGEDVGMVWVRRAFTSFPIISTAKAERMMECQTEGCGCQESSIMALRP